MNIVTDFKPWHPVIRWEDGKFKIFIGAGGLPNDAGWDVFLSSGFSCSYQTTKPDAVRRLVRDGYKISQQAADQLANAEVRHGANDTDPN
jgi:hypothetical protein